jgi:DNA-binding CsgD family transcriptional regulator
MSGVSVNLREALLEREGELELIAGALERAACGEGAVVLVEGVAGVGKTRLLREAASCAVGAGAQVMLATGGEVERDLGWGVARGLLAGAFEREGARWTGAAKLAGPIFSDVGLTGEASLGAMLHGLFWMVAQLADERPLCLIVDDAQWADMPSLRWLAYMAARVQDLGVVIAIGVRSGETSAADEFLEAIGCAPATQLVVVSPLSRQASDDLVSSELAGSGEEVYAACFHATGGLPFLLHGLLDELRGRTTIRPADISEIQPERITRWLRSSLGALSAPAQQLARAIAVLGVAVALRHAAELSGLEDLEATHAADELARARLLESGLPLRFTHPLVRGVVHQLLGPAELVAAHAHAAAIIRRSGARPTEIAVHLLHVEPRGDAEVVQTLLGAAEESMGRGDPNTTVVLMCRALREPPPPPLEGRVLRQLGLAQAALGDEEGFTHLEAALAATADGARRAEIALELSRSLRMGGEQSRAVGPLERALAELPESSTLAPTVEAELINVALLDADTFPQALQRLSRFSDPAALTDVKEPGMLADLALASLGSGYGTEVSIALARSALAGLDHTDPEPSALVYALKTLACCDELDQARAEWDTIIETARERGLENMSAFGCLFRAEVNLWAGLLPDAEADACLATDALAQWGRRALEPVSILVLILIERGQVKDAQQRLEAHTPAELPELWDTGVLLCARARLRLAQGRADQAIEDALDAGERLSAALRDSGLDVTPALLPWRSTAAIAMVSDGGPSREAAQLAEEEVVLARSLGARRALGVALRASALAHTGEQRLSGLEQSVAVLAASPARLEHARSLYALGGALRRSKRRVQAREYLRDALDRAHRCGAQALAGEAAEELRLAGARPRRERISGPNALTTAELRIARLAAEGRTNREIAQLLFITARTVETHLTHTYQKLDITSRQQLGNALRT